MTRDGYHDSLSASIEILELESRNSTEMKVKIYIHRVDGIYSDLKYGAPSITQISKERLEVIQKINGHEYICDRFVSGQVRWR